MHWPDLVGHCTQRSHPDHLKYPQDLSLASYLLFSPTGSETGWAMDKGKHCWWAPDHHPGTSLKVVLSPAPPWVPASNCPNQLLTLDMLGSLGDRHLGTFAGMLHHHHHHQPTLSQTGLVAGGKQEL